MLAPTYAEFYVVEKNGVGHQIFVSPPPSIVYYDADSETFKLMFDELPQTISIVIPYSLTRAKFAADIDGGSTSVNDENDQCVGCSPFPSEYGNDLHMKKRIVIPSPVPKVAPPYTLTMYPIADTTATQPNITAVAMGVILLGVITGSVIVIATRQKTQRSPGTRQQQLEREELTRRQALPKQTNASEGTLEDALKEHDRRVKE